MGYGTGGGGGTTMRWREGAAGRAAGWLLVRKDRRGWGPEGEESGGGQERKVAKTAGRMRERCEARRLVDEEGAGW